MQYVGVVLESTRWVMGMWAWFWKRAMSYGYVGVVWKTSDVICPLEMCRYIYSSFPTFISSACVLVRVAVQGWLGRCSFVCICSKCEKVVKQWIGYVNIYRVWCDVLFRTPEANVGVACRLCLPVVFFLIVSSWSLRVAILIAILSYGYFQIYLFILFLGRAILFHACGHFAVVHYWFGLTRAGGGAIFDV